MHNHLSITTNEQLSEVCQQLASASYLALDTEFMRRNTFYPKLALLQIASDELVVLVDPLNITEWQPLRALLVDASILKLMHSCWEDLEVCFYHLGVVPENLIDTQLAAAFAGIDWSMSYHRMVNDLLEVELAKSETLTNWLQRPLTAKQIDYAKDDVLYLHACWQKLKQTLDDLSVMQPLQEQHEILFAKFKRSLDDELSYLKVKGLRSLSHKQQAILKAICCWREGLAKKKDLPRSWIVPDKTLVDIVRKQPKDVDGLLNCAKKDVKKVQRYANDILAMLHDEQYATAEHYPAYLPAHTRLAKGHPALQWRDKLDALAQQYGSVAPALLSKDEFFSMLKNDEQGDIEYYVPDDWPAWKQTMIGQPMVAWLSSLEEH